MEQRSQWIAPSEASGDETENGIYKGLKVYNSLTCSKVKFVPAKGNRVTWYICGPTVYDSSHMGHARNYVTFDIIRRILEDYFNYQVHTVMNITDVDDKIILKARHSHLFSKYAASHKTLDGSVLADLNEAWPLFIAGIEKKIAVLQDDKKKKEEEKAAEVRLQQERLAEATKAFAQVKQTHPDSTQPAEALLELSRGALSSLLDKREGEDVNDPAIFRETAARYEKEFLEDMSRLGVRMPDVLTRVSEYIPHIVDYVKRIEANKFAYFTDSVYFDTTAFKAAGHGYGKLEPWSVGNERLLEEGEGGLSIEGRQKKSSNDFALWKASKPGEPHWESPWGLGRPGWHIECSAMVHAHVPDRLDVHCGGEDLRFPHHDNEIAQAEAYYGCHQWTNYFLHVGHLHIEGLKMSKSLKNFITIRQALEVTTPRQMRILFLMKPWDKTMNYAEAAMEDVRGKEKKLSEFFLGVQNVMRDSNITEQDQLWTEPELALHKKLEEVQETVDRSLKDSFDTPSAMEALHELVSQTNIYFSKTKQRRSYLVQRVGTYVTRILKVFGVIESDSVGWEGASKSSSDEQDLTPAVLNALAAFRKEIRTAARDNRLDRAAMLALCDRMRDEVMPPLGVRLEDEGDFPWKLVNAQELMRELEAKRATERQAQKQKLQSKRDSLLRDLQKFNDSKPPPASIFSKDEYSQFDERGVPTHDAKGAPLAKSATKQVAKLFDAQKKKYDALQLKLQTDPDFEAKLQRDIDELTEQLKKY